MDYKVSLKAARVNAEKTIQEVSGKIGVSKQTVVNWEAGRTQPTAGQFRALSELYSAPLDCLRMPIKSNNI